MLLPFISVRKLSQLLFHRRSFRQKNAINTTFCTMIANRKPFSAITMEYKGFDKLKLIFQHQNLSHGLTSLIRNFFNFAV